MGSADLLFADRDASLPAVHPVDTRRFIVYIPSDSPKWKGTHAYGSNSGLGGRDVFVAHKGTHWFASIYYSDLDGPSIVRYTDEVLDEYKEKGYTILAIMIGWESRDQGQRIACHFHAEVYDVPPTDEKMLQELIFQLKSRNFCLTDGAMDVMIGIHSRAMQELNESKKQIDAIKRDLFKESKSYLTRLRKRVGDIMQGSAPLAEETFINAGQELKQKQKEIAGRLTRMYENEWLSSATGLSGSESHRMARVGLVLADNLIDRLIENVYHQGIQKSNEKLVKAIATVEAMMPPELRFKVPDEFIKIKKEQLALAYEIEAYKREQKELRRRELEAKREEARAQKELEREQKKAEKDALAAQAAIERNKFEMAQAKTKEEIEKYQKQILKLEEALKQAQERRERALSMAQQTKCGYVYIISNIGSFGEGVYKIGMTRRVEPMERVAELGDASVPFPFDVHAMIYTEDAPGLESSLHRTFDSRKLNAVNGRKEFFRVSLEEVKAEVQRLGIECEWIEKPLASQFRDSEVLRRK